MMTTDEMRSDALAIPRAWVGCLGCYNAGRLNGRWVEGLEATNVDTLATDEGFCRRCGSDEFWVFDHEGYAGILEGECSPAEAERLAEILEEATDPHALAAYVSYHGRHYLEEALETFDDAYRGEWDSEEQYAEELARDVGDLDAIPEHLRSYFDVGRYARDLFIGDYHSARAPGGGVYVFSRHV